mmetsp:Transcript_13894/g.21664  ORF Transcript_13894/g.21664 Transcript_13894/m.21664 type:complete len:82 (+) Transcript_13894:30-275(+)
MWTPMGENGRFTMLPDEAPEIDEDAKTAAAEAIGGQLMSSNTYANIVHNKDNIDYCIDQFNYITNRIKCIKLMTGNGPFLA